MSRVTDKLKDALHLEKTDKTHTDTTTAHTGTHHKDTHHEKTHHKDKKHATDHSLTDKHSHVGQEHIGRNEPTHVTELPAHGDAHVVGDPSYRELTGEQVVKKGPFTHKVKASKAGDATVTPHIEEKAHGDTRVIGPHGYYVPPGTDRAVVGAPLATGVPPFAAKDGTHAKHAHAFGDTHVTGGHPAPVVVKQPKTVVEKHKTVEKHVEKPHKEKKIEKHKVEKPHKQHAEHFEHHEHHAPAPVTGHHVAPAPVSSGAPVIIEQRMNAPIVKEHHHEHVTEVVHPSVERQHETVEVQQLTQPVYEQVAGGHTEGYGGQTVRAYEKFESDEHARRQMEANRAHLAAQQGGVTHTQSHDVMYATPHERDVVSGHKVIQEVTPVIHRDIHHDNVVHKDEKVVEKIKHAPQVNMVQGQAAPHIAPSS